MILVWLLLLLILYIVLLSVFSRRAYAYEKKPHDKSPANFDIPFKEVRIPVPQGGELYGWWIPAKPDMPTLVLIHGWSRTVERTLPYIRHLHPLGYNLLTIDARNHGSSSKLEAPTVGTFTEDVLVAVDYLAAQDPSIMLGVIGLSIGGGASIAAAGQDKRIQATVSVGAIAHPIELMKAHFAQRKIPGFLASSLFLYMRLHYGIDFERIAPTYADTVDDQWNLAEWCRAHRLPRRREEVLRRILQLDPNHPETRHALGYQQLGGEWVTTSEWRRREGYVLYRGRWRLAQDIELIEAERKTNAMEKEWAGKLGISECYASQLVCHARCPSPRLRRRMLEVMGPADFEDLFEVELPTDE